MDDGVVRCFIAIELPGTIKDGLRSVQGTLKTRTPTVVRWTDVHGIHLTLKFLGDVDAGKIGHIEKSIGEVVSSVSKFQLSLGMPGAFPGLKRPKVIWVGVDGELEQLVSMQGAVEDCLEDLGFAKEGRPFRAHLTVGRLMNRVSNSDMEAVGFAIRSLDWNWGQGFQVKGLSLVRSKLTPRGAIYSPMVHLPLAA